MGKHGRHKRKTTNSEWGKDDKYDEKSFPKDQLLNILDRYASEFLGDVPTEKQKKCKIVDCPHASMEPTDPITKPKKEVEVVVFKSRKSRKEKVEKPNNVNSNCIETEPKLETRPNKSKFSNERLNSAEVLEKLKFTVGSFGMKAFSKEEQREHEQRRAIKLGAKPTKRKYVNYKVLMDEKKRLKEDQIHEKTSLQHKKNETKEKSTGLSKFWKQGNKSFNPQVGKYRDGVLKLSSKDIKSVNRRR